MDYKTKLDDDKQTRLSSNGILPNNSFTKQYFPIVNFNDKVVCPFCLNFIEFGKGFMLEKGFYKCLKCGTLIVKKTLKEVIIMSPEQFAFWVYNYRLNGFWDKVKPNFHDWTVEMDSFANNFSRRFWDKYKEIRGDNFEDKE